MHPPVVLRQEEPAAAHLHGHDERSVAAQSVGLGERALLDDSQVRATVLPAVDAHQRAVGHATELLPWQQGHDRTVARRRGIEHRPADGAFVVLQGHDLIQSEQLIVDHAVQNAPDGSGGMAVGLVFDGGVCSVVHVVLLCEAEP